MILSPLSQFEVLNLIGLNSPLLGNLHISLTNISLYSLFILTIIIGLHILGNNENNLVPNK
jgi:F-type H+-transporting ATPase subunit a